MPNIFHQSVEDILRAATPEQRLLWNYIFLRFGERVPISQLYYIGALTGTQFLVYNARRLYVIYSAQFASDFIPNLYAATKPSVQFFNENNVVHFVANKANTYWDATAAAPRNMNPMMKVENFYFSRILQSNMLDYQYVTLIGYSIAI